MQRLDKAIPGIDLPPGPVDLVASMDAKLASLDQMISDLSSRAAERTGASATATAIAAGATRLERGLADATEMTTNIQSKIQGMQGRVGDIQDRVGGLLSWGAAGVALVFVWVLVLNLALFALGRRAWRSAVTGSAAGDLAHVVREDDHRQREQPQEDRLEPELPER